MSIRRREREGVHKVMYFTRFEAAGTQGKGGAGGYVGPPRAPSNGRENWMGSETSEICILAETSLTCSHRDDRKVCFLLSRDERESVFLRERR